MLDTSELLTALGHEPKTEEEVIGSLQFEDDFNIPMGLTDVEAWENYTNDELYFLDKKVREFIKQTTYKRLCKGEYKTTAPIIFVWIYHRQPEPKDGYLFHTIHTLLKYYCTDFTGQTTFKGKPVSRVYRFSKYACKCKRPYSLRLRLEEADNPNADSIWRNNPGYRKDKQVHHRRSNKDNGTSKTE